MKKYPPSILVSLYASMGLTGLFLGFSFLSCPQSINLLWHSLIFFTVCMVTLTLVIELVIYRKMKVLEVERQQEIRKLKEIEEIRREFIGNVSHELKTPIFAIEGFIETLLGGALEDEKVNRKFLKRALKQAERLSTLVQDLLVITKIESGDIEMKINPFNARQLVQEVMDSLEHKLTRKGRDITMNFSAPDQLNTNVMGDRERIEQVLYNLVDNAIKYGDPAGEVNIEIKDYDDDHLLIKVQDDGPGIEARHLPRLFERFYRVDKSRSRDKGGTGLGLAICKHLVEAHDERIWVESVAGQGATFQFTLTKEA